MKLNEWIIRQLLSVPSAELRQMRSKGHVMARTADVMSDRMTDDTFRIAYADWSRGEEVKEADGREWLMAFNFAVELFGAPQLLHYDEPLEHPWGEAFDNSPPDRILAMLIQFLIKFDPIEVLERDRRFLTH